MYAIIYWVDDERVYPLTCRISHYEGQLKLFDTLKEADRYASKLEKDENVECRVICIEGVKE